MAENCTHDCSSCSADCSSRDLRVPANAMSSIKRVIAVVSGKGGVGKSTVTASLAAAMAKKGRKVAVLDADITGPSIPTAFGVHQRATGSDAGIDPAVTAGGIKLMSLNLLSANETDPVIWRGPVIAGVVTQFWQEVLWGDIDYMFVDMPPGTGDVPLTVFQSLPVDGVIVVTSPQDLVSMIVAKAVNMAKMMDIPVLGLERTTAISSAPTAENSTPSSVRAISTRWPGSWRCPCWPGCLSTPLWPPPSTPEKLRTSQPTIWSSWPTGWRAEKNIPPGENPAGCFPSVWPVSGLEHDL